MKTLNTKTHRVFVVATLLCSLLTVSDSALLAQEGRADLPPGFESGRSPLLTYETKHLLGISVIPVEQGLEVVDIQDHSPVLDLKSPDDPNTRGKLEVHDVLISVDGMTVKNLEELRASLASCQGQCELKILNHHNQDVVVAIATPKVEEQPSIKVAVEAANTKKVHVIVAGLTNDPLLGRSIYVSQLKIESMFKAYIQQEQLHMTILSGDDCNAQMICETIQSQPVGFKDSLVFYYLGHGAFDPTYAVGDTYGGHFLDMPSGDLLRRTVWDHLNGMPARFKVFISDACNVESIADPEARIVADTGDRTISLVGPTALEWLFLGHSGSWDAMSARKGERAWYSPDVGGWFSDCFVRETLRSHEWARIADQLPTEVNKFYQVKKAEFLTRPATTEAITLAQLRSQGSMVPVLRNHARIDSQPPVSLDLKRTINQPYIVRKRLP